MVATRRGTRLSSPAKTTTDEASGTSASSTRTTRSRTVLVKTQSQSEQTSDQQQEEAEENAAPAELSSSPKRVTRSSKCPPTDKQPESVHEADVSESESCSSLVLDIQPTSSRRRRRATVQAKAPTVDEDEAPKPESSSSSLSQTPRRSTRGQRRPVHAFEATTLQEDEHSDAESSSSVASFYKRVTRSHRKPTVAPEDAAHSEAESCSSVVSGHQGSTVCRSTRSRVKVVEAMPINLEQSKTAQAVFEPRRSRARGGKAKSAEEEQRCDSESCQSGPSFSPRRSTRSRGADSDAESILSADTPFDSPCSTRSRGTPCSSRTGSASSARALRASRSKIAMVALVHSEENEPEEDPSEIPEDILCLSGSADSDLEEMEEDTNNTTVIAAVQENHDGNLTLTLHEGDAEVIEPECRKDISSETEKDVEECREIAQEAMETHKDASAREVPAVEEESSSRSMMPQMSVAEAEEGQSDLSEQPVLPVLRSCDQAKQEEDLEVLSEPEGKAQATKEMIEGETMVGQQPSEESVREVTDDDEGPSSSTKASKKSTDKSKPVKERVSLLDSSEEESDDDDGLSVDGGDDEVGDLDGEDEACSVYQPHPSGTSDSIKGNGLFVIDARPGCDSGEQYYIDTAQTESKTVEDEEEFVDEEDDDDEEGEDEDSKVLFTTRKPALNDLSSSIDPGLKLKALGGLYINFDGSKSKSVSSNLMKLKDQKNHSELLKRSVIVPDFEKKDSVPPYKESKHGAKLKRREERAKNTGAGWFNMRAPELTEELKNDLKALQMRSAMDPKRFYKKKDRDGFPKYFQVGTVVDNPIDFYHSRIPKKERKRTIVEELLADAEFRSFNKRKYAEIMAEKATAAAGKLNKKKLKFHKKK